jgi:hypothetical protein
MKKVFTLIGLIISLQSFSQGYANDKLMWIDPGLDFSIAMKDKGFSGYGLNVGLNYLNNKTTFKLKYQYLTEGKSDVIIPMGHINNFGLMAGRGIITDHSTFQFSGGIGIIFGTIKGEYLRSETYISGYKTSYSFGSIFGNGGSTTVPVYNTREIYEEHKFITASFPLEADLIIKGDYVGLCIGVFGDINKVQSIYGLSLKMFLGGAL